MIPYHNQLMLAQCDDGPGKAAEGDIKHEVGEVEATDHATMFPEVDLGGADLS